MIENSKHVIGAAASAPLVPLKPHPRLLADEACFAAAMARLAKSETPRKALALLRRAAEKMLAQPPVEFQMVGRRLHMSVRAAHRRIEVLAFLWRMTGDARFADRARREALAVCAFDNWNPAHFLDAAELTYIVGLALDWLYDAISPEDRRTMAEAILLKGLTIGDGRTLPTDWWVDTDNNWNLVCNGGLAIGAAAVREFYPEVAEAILRRSRACLPFALKSYAEGNFPEGVAYWNYASLYAAKALAVLEGQFADGAPELFTVDGLAAQVDYLDLMTGPTGQVFNYSDNYSSINAFERLPTLAQWYFAWRFGRPDALRVEQRLMEAYPDRIPVLALFWFQDAAGNGQDGQAVCAVLGGANPLAVLRSKGGANAWYVGVKGGMAAANHGHEDIGSFVLEAGGVRWAVDLPCEDYNRIEQMKTVDLWNRGQESSRWALFRLGLAGHGTLHIDGARPLVNGWAPVTREGPFAVSVDLSPCYGGGVSVRRTFALGEGTLVIDDELSGLAFGTGVSWNMNTLAEATVFGDAVELRAETGSGVPRRMALESKAGGAAWEVESVAEPRTPADAPNPGVRRVRLRGKADPVGKLRFSVVFKLVAS